MIQATGRDVSILRQLPSDFVDLARSNSAANRLEDRLHHHVCPIRIQTEFPSKIIPNRIGGYHSKALRTYQRRTLTADALIAGAYLAGTSTRRVRRALSALFRGAVSKDIVSRVWRKIKSDWDAWNARSLADEPMVRLILDGTVVRVRLDRKTTSISLLVVIGVRADDQKVLLAVKHMGGESTEAWRSVLDDLIARGLRQPAFLIVDGAPGFCDRLQRCPLKAGLDGSFSLKSITRTTSPPLE